MRPWTAAIPYIRTDEQIFEYACHEGNYGMEGILQGARCRRSEDRGGHQTMTSSRLTVICRSAAAALLAPVTRSTRIMPSPLNSTRSSRLRLRGTVTRVEWINPHTWIHIEVKNADGKVVEWMIEGGTPNTLLRRGVDRKSLPAGTEIVVDGYRAKSGTIARTAGTSRWPTAVNCSSARR